MLRTWNETRSEWGLGNPTLYIDDHANILPFPPNSHEDNHRLIRKCPVVVVLLSTACIDRVPIYHVTGMWTIISKRIIYNNKMCKKVNWLKELSHLLALAIMLAMQFWTLDWSDVQMTIVNYWGITRIMDILKNAEENLCSWLYCKCMEYFHPAIQHHAVTSSLQANIHMQLNCRNELSLYLTLFM